ncbi:sialoadhesin-like isoform 1-T1 [Salvelinus alpinus]|uniref:high affinity immunoglobulin gamma Fc receptor I-like isoform X1 n=1 Tax=Salvelinus alpinus TaxID=8036 RepID=UPI0039FC54D8
MNSLSVYIILGLTALMIQTTDSKGSPNIRAVLSVWPPGSTIYIRESVALGCSVEAGANYSWTYHWFRHTSHKLVTPNARHMISGDSYSITGVAKADGGSYWCQAERNGSTTPLLSDPAHLTVSELTPPSLAVIPNSRQHFQGERFSLQCPAVSESNSTESNSTDWTLWQLTDFGVRSGCQTLKGTVRKEVPGACSLSSLYSGLYWCESSKWRSNTVNITVSYGSMIIVGPAHPVTEGDQVTLHCRYWFHKPNQTTFYKDGVEVVSLNVTEMTIDNVNGADEGFYKCAEPEEKLESPESWLSVRRNSTSEERKTLSSEGTWMWVLLFCCIVVILLLIPVVMLLVRHYRLRMWCTRSCFSSKEGPPPGEAPQTKQDVTEVQWDLGWMEMANLLDKQQYPATAS